ncbi:ribonuclease H-like domain-containing protein [Tanacetum coccineum]
MVVVANLVEKVVEDEEVATVDGVFEGAFRALGDNTGRFGNGSFSRCHGGLWWLIMDEEGDKVIVRIAEARSAYAIISNEESHRIATGSVSGTSQRSQTFAFNVNAPNRGNFQRSQTSTSFLRPSKNDRPNDNGNMRTVGGSTLVCENCGFNDHSIDKCFKIIRYPADFGKRKAGSNFKGKNVSNNVVGSSSSNGFSDEQMTTLISLIKENFVNGKRVHSNMAGTYMNSSTVFNKNFEKFFCSNSSLHSKLVSKWLVTDSVTHPNRTGAFITRIGNMPLTDYLTSYDVLVVPEYCDLRKGKMGTGKQIGGLYYSDGNQSINFKNVKSNNGGIPLNMWSECVLTATYLIKRLPTSVLNGKSPYDLVYNKPYSLKHLRSFGCLAYADILNSHDKFGSRFEKCVLVGYSNSKKGYKLWSLDNKQIIYSKDVKFFEDIFPFKQNNLTGINNSVKDVNHLNFFNTNTLDDLPEIPNDEERRNPNPIRHGNLPSHSADEENNSNSESNDLHDQSQDNVSQDNVSQDNNGAQNLRRSSRTSVFLKNYNDFIVDSKVKYGLEKYVNYSHLSKGNYCFATMLNKGVEPKSYLEASQHKHRVDAMNAKMDALYRNNTWEIVDLPVGRKAIVSKWVWKMKYKSDREIERYKARLVSKGFNQKEGIDFDETFSPVVKIVTVRCLINLAVQNGWSLFQIDINNAFLYGDFEETLYMTLPAGYFPDNETKSKSDYSLFTKSFGDVFIALLGYVDDIIITGNSLTEIEKVKQFLKIKFMIKDLGKLKYFLGIEVLNTPKGIYLNQRKYYLELIDEFGLLAGKPSNLPMRPNISLTGKPSDTDPLLDNVTEYQKLIGKLIYLTNTRPDIAYTVSCFSQFMHNPLKSHLKTALKVINNLKGSPCKGINVIKGSASSIDLKAYSDADWARLVPSCCVIFDLEP